MTSLNFDKVGRQLAIIKEGKLNKKIVSVYTDKTEDDDDKISKEFIGYTIPDQGKFQQLPNFDLEREIGYITAPSGAGKSTYIKNYIKEWKKKHKDDDIYLFSALRDDESLDEIKPQRVKIDESLLSDPLTVEDFKNSIVIFDDIDVIGDKKVREAVYNVLNQILECGRHFQVSCLITNHLATNGKDTRRVLNECMFITVFFGAGAVKGINYLLETYIGLDKKEIRRIKQKSKNSRWTTIFKNYPQVALTEKSIWTLAGDE